MIQKLPLLFCVLSLGLIQLPLASVGDVPLLVISFRSGLVHVCPVHCVHAIQLFCICSVFLLFLWFFTQQERKKTFFSKLEVWLLNAGNATRVLGMHIAEIPNVLPF